MKIYGFKLNDKVVSIGFANSISKFIAINENISELDSIYTSFHEAAHIQDDVNNKIPVYANWLTGSATVGCLSGLPWLISRLETISPVRFLIPLSIAIGSCYGVSLVYLGAWFHSNIAVPWAVEQAEYRADKMAFEKLLDMNRLDPILSVLMDKWMLFEYQGYTRSHGHPPANFEYKAMKKTLQNRGYEITRYHQSTQNLFRISVTKDDNGREMEVSWKV